MKEEIINRFKEELERKGIKRPADLKKVIGSNYTTAQNYFHGYNVPNLETIAKLHKEIGLDVMYVING